MALKLTVPPYVATRLKASGNASAAVKALVDAELARESGAAMDHDAQIRMQSEYETMILMGHPIEFALKRISSNWGLTIDALRKIVEQYSAEATRQAAQTISDARAHMEKQAEIEQRREERQHKLDPRLNKLNR